MFFKFPYTDLYSLNLDWILTQIKNYTEYLEQLKTDLPEAADIEYLKDNIPLLKEIIENLDSIVTSVNGMSGDVNLGTIVHSVNGLTGNVQLGTLVNSVNGQTGAVTLDNDFVNGLKIEVVLQTTDPIQTFTPANIKALFNSGIRFIIIDNSEFYTINPDGTYVKFNPTTPSTEIGNITAFTTAVPTPATALTLYNQGYRFVQSTVSDIKRLWALEKIGNIVTPYDLDAYKGANIFNEIDVGTTIADYSLATLQQMYESGQRILFQDDTRGIAKFYCLVGGPNGYERYIEYNPITFVNLYIAGPIYAEIEKIKNSKVSNIASANMLDPSDPGIRIVNGYYIGYDTGLQAPNPDYSYAVMPAQPGTKYMTNLENAHIAFFSSNNISTSTYLGGFYANTTNGYITTASPADTKYVTFSYPTAQQNTMEFAKVYETTREIIKNTGILRVGPSREYRTIQSAINAAEDGDTIYIDPGVYTEAVDAVTPNKFLHFIGSGKNATVIQYSGNNYADPPLEIAKGIVENIRFQTLTSTPASGAIDSAYAVHIDFNQEEGNSLQFINCTFSTPARPTVGIGTRANFTLNFTNCMFASSTPVIYFHEQQASNKTGQNIEFIDCSMLNAGTGAVIRMQYSPEFTGNNGSVLFQRCIAKTSGSQIIESVTYPAGSGAPSGSGYQGSAVFYLNSASALNSQSVMDAS